MKLKSNYKNNWMLITVINEQLLNNFLSLFLSCMNPTLTTQIRMSSNLQVSSGVLISIMTFFVATMTSTRQYLWSCKKKKVLLMTAMYGSFICCISSVLTDLCIVQLI